MPKVNKVYVWRRIPRLPSEYQEVEWIGASGNQYINTGYVINTNTSRIYTKFEPQNVSTSQGSSTYQNPLFGTRTSDYNYETCLWASPSNQTYSVGLSLNGYTQSQATPADSFPKYPLGTIIELDYGKTGGTYNSFTFTRNAQYQGVTPNLLIFGIWTQGSVDARKFFGKLYSFKIYEGDNEVRNFVPCYRKSDNVIGMYDLVNNQFYTNSGSGTFTKGSDVTEGVDNTVYKEFLVRPVTQELHYYIDFRTAGSLPSDWTATSGGTVNSNGLNASSVVWKQIDLSNANNLSITVTGNRTTTTWAGYDQLGIWDAPSSGTICYRLRADYRSNYTYQNEGTSLRYMTGGTETALNTVTGKTPSGGNYTYTYNVDFNTGAWTASQYDSSSGYTNSPSYTLSDSQIAELKTLTRFYMNLANPNSITNYCYTVTIDIT